MLVAVRDPRLTERVLLVVTSDEREPNVGVSVLVKEELTVSLFERTCWVSETVCDGVRVGPELVDEREMSSDAEDVRLKVDDAVSV